jgi:hypothetical protein
MTLDGYNCLFVDLQLDYIKSKDISKGGRFRDESPLFY